MMSAKYGFRSGKYNPDWHQLSSLITGRIPWTFHDTGGPTDLSEGVVNTMFEAIKVTQK